MDALGCKEPVAVTLWEKFEQVAGRFPERVALVMADPACRRTWTYSELAAAARKGSDMFAAHGVRPGDIVAVIADRQLETVAAYLAALRLGAAYLPIDPRFPQDRITYMLGNARPRLVLADRLIQLESVYQVDILERNCFNGEDLRKSVPGVKGSDAACIMYTSGSTGVPKGVVLPHRSIIRLLCGADYYEFGADRIFLQLSALTFDVSILEIFGALLHGGRSVLFPYHGVPDLELLRSVVSDERVTTAWLTTSLFNSIVSIDTSVLEGIGTLIVGGEALSVPHMRQAQQCLRGTVFINGYGPTENHISTCFTVPRPIPEDWSSIPIGKPIAGSTAYLLDDRLQPVTEGEIGELFVGGYGVALGYLNKPELTAERFVPDPFIGVPDMLMYRTGDLARDLGGGILEYLGRNDMQVKIRGNRIELGEIENILLVHPAVTDAKVRVKADGNGDRHLVAYYLTDGADLEDLAELLASKLPSAVVPSKIVRLAFMPLNTNGKLDEGALPNPFDAGLVAAWDRQTSTMSAHIEWSDVGDLVENLWRLVLPAETPFTRSDNFFEVGGTSLGTLQIAARLSRELDRPVPVIRLFEYPTIAQLTSWLSGEGLSGEETRLRVSSGTRKASRLSGQDDAIAIIGMSGRFPGASDVRQFWHNLLNSQESITFLEPKDLDPSVAHLAADPGYIRAKGILEGAEFFDAGFFGISPGEARMIDPQQRVLLELAVTAMEDAGYGQQNGRGRVGVFCGTNWNQYQVDNIATHPDIVQRYGEFNVSLANEADFPATRIAYKLDLRGPALSIFTACSTGLVAVAEAVKSLRSHECEMALAGGASLSLPQRQGYQYQEGGMLSKDGHTRSFDAAATGTTFNEGAALIVLKRLTDAVADRDHIYAVVLGAAINNDGAGKVSFTAPSVGGQAEVIRSALANAEVDADSVTFVETHGTATPLGDPIEVEALNQVYCRSSTAGPGSCVLGSVKSNVGHLIHASGTAGLIKLALSAEQGVIPATLHFKEPNPELSLDQTRFRVSADTERWASDRWPRRGAVSSFGVGGTNSHVIVEEPPLQESSDSDSKVSLYLFSARHSDGPVQSALELADRLDEDSALNLGDVAFTLATGRTAWPHRLAVAAANREDLIPALRAGGRGRGVLGEASSPFARLAFSFPGQGAQLPGMGAAMYATSQAFRSAMDECLSIADSQLDIDLRKLTVEVDSDETARALLEKTCYTQPALFAIGYALARHLEHIGILPDVMIGHSVGEFVAATVAGVMTLGEGMTLIVERGRLMQAMPPGGMLAVLLPEKEAEEFARTHGLTVAAINAPGVVVLSGETDRIDGLAVALKERGVRNTKLRTSHAFHSAMMDPAVEAFGSIVREVQLRAPRIPIVSTATGALLTAAEATSPEYWQSHLRVPVRFSSALQRLLSEGRTGVIELGPGATLTSLAQRQSDDSHVFVAALGARAMTEPESVMLALGQLWVEGANIPWHAMFRGETRSRVSLPTYPFARQRHWIEAEGGSSVSTGAAALANEVEAELPTGGSSMSAAYDHHAEIFDRVTRLFEDVSGMELRGTDPDRTFPELGFDSLFMTQASAAIKREFSAAVSFRELSGELDSISALARHLADKVSLPPSVERPVAAAARPVLDQSSGRDGPPSADRSQFEKLPMQDLIAEQMRLLARQLDLLGGASGERSRPPVDMPDTQQQLRIPAPEIQAKDLAPGKLPLQDGDDRPLSPTSWEDLDPRRRQALQEFIQEHAARTSGSKEHIARFRKHHADPRTAAGFSRIWKEMVYPIVCDRSAGSRLWDLDGNEYIDLLNGFGPNFLGHSHPEIVEAIEREMAHGFEIGPQQRLAGETAEMICEFTGMDRASFVCTGSEAVQAAIRCARTFTQRDRIVVFRGDYHGNFDEVLVRGVTGGGCLKTISSAPGVPAASVSNVIVLDYGHDSALSIIDRLGDQIAAVLVEPVQSRRPELQPREFLHKLRAITEKHGVLLIFDEVVTGFRCHPGGAQAHFEVRADLATYGKVAGGNLPLGIVAGRQAVMDTFDGGQWNYGDDSVPEAGVTFFAGTFVRQPFAIAACHAMLEILRREGPGLQRRVNMLTEFLAGRINAICADYALPFEMAHFSSVMYLRNRDRSDLGSLLWYYLRHHGLFALEGFPTYLTAAHTEEDIDQIVTIFRLSVERMLNDGMLYSGRMPGAGNGRDGIRPQASLAPPVPGARLGKDPQGNPAWYVPDPERPGAFLRVG